MRHRGAIGGDVMGNELPEDGPPGRDSARLVPQRIADVTRSPGATDRPKDVGTDAQMRQIREHPRVAMATQRFVSGASRRHTVVARRPLRLTPWFRPRFDYHTLTPPPAIAKHPELSGLFHELVQRAG